MHLSLTQTSSSVDNSLNLINICSVLIYTSSMHSDLINQTSCMQIISTYISPMYLSQYTNCMCLSLLQYLKFLSLFTPLTLPA